MQIDDIRFHFENHIEKFYPDLSLAFKSIIPASYCSGLRENAGEEYQDPGVQLMWMMFLAGARAQHKNTAITLPAPKSRPDGYFDAGFNDGIQECRRTLVAAGIKIKK